MDFDWEDEPERSGNVYGVLMTPVSSVTDPKTDHDYVTDPRDHSSMNRTHEPLLNPRKPVPQVRERRHSQDLVVKQTHKKSIFLQWWRELGAILLSAVVLVALVATLYPHNGKPLPQWPYSISVNALVSIYVLVAKASILFVTAEGISQLKWIWYTESRTVRDFTRYDEASRGAQGALGLLLDFQARGLLASSGALVMLLMLFVDPFTQQVLRYYDCSVILKGSEASVARTSLLEDFGPSSKQVFPGRMSVPPNWQDAVNAGIFSPGQKPKFNCPTGNCTFPNSYGTMGYCSNCQDVSNSLSVFNQTWTSHDTTYNTTDTYWGWNTSLPSGTSVINLNGDPTLNYTTMAGFGGDTFMEIILGKTIDDGINTALGQPQGCDGSTSAQNSWRCRGYGAARCSITPCVQLYSSNVTLGSLEEVLVDVSQDHEWSTFGYNGIIATLDVTCLSTQERQGLDKAGYHIRDGQRWLAYNTTWDIYSEVPKDAGFPQSMLRHGCLYAFNFDLPQSLWWDYLSTFFSGNLTGTILAVETDPTFLTGPQSLKSLFNYGNTGFERVDSIFHNISESLTNIARLTGSSNHSAAAVGAVMHAQTCLQVRWAWLSFLAITCLVAWMFFIALIVAHLRNEWLPAWKSSPLPLLFQGLAGQDNDRTGDMNELKKRAGQLRMQLTQSDEGLKLVEE